MSWWQSGVDLVSYLGIVRFLSRCSATDIVFLFLLSKPLFVAVAAVVGFRSYRASRQLTVERSEEARIEERRGRQLGASVDASSERVFEGDRRDS